MLKEYKGVNLDKNSDIKNYIATYHILDRDNYLDYLERDKVLQNLIREHQLKSKFKILLYNLVPYIMISTYIILEIQQ